MNKGRYYVYVYIDPCNHEEFYYGKGTGSRKLAHLEDTGDSEKVKRISRIRDEGLEPIIRVLAADLNEQEALLIEATLIWKLGRILTNEMAGHLSEKFRPHDTLHKELPCFDNENDFYYVNIGEGSHRDWADCKRYGFLSAGGENPIWKNQIQKLIKGDVVAAYLAGHGYVGIGIVTEKAVPMMMFNVDGIPLSRYDLAQPGMRERMNDIELTEYVVRIKWINVVERDQAFFSPRSGLFTTQLIRVSLSSQPITVTFLEDSFNVQISDLLSESHRNAQIQPEIQWHACCLLNTLCSFRELAACKN